MGRIFEQKNDILLLQATPATKRVKRGMPLEAENISKMTLLKNKP